MPKGNPFATNSIEDPGLRKQIFNASFEDVGDYVLESGISARAYKMCDTEFKNRVATNMKGYEKVRKNLMKIEARKKTIATKTKFERSVINDTEEKKSSFFPKSARSVVSAIIIICVISVFSFRRLL